MDSELPRPFVLVRDEDVSGVSGTGVVAEGVEFSGGAVALKWTSQWPTSVVFHERGIESVQAVHGHSGKTRIVYATSQPALTDQERHAIEWLMTYAEQRCGVSPPAPIVALLERLK